MSGIGGISFETGKKEDYRIHLGTLLECSVWLITLAFHVNYQVCSSFKTGKKRGDQSSEKDGEVQITLVTGVLEQRNMGKLLVVWGF